MFWLGLIIGVGVGLAVPFIVMLIAYARDGGR